MYTERMFHLPVDWTVDLLADQVPVFLNELHHRGVNGYTNIYLNNGLNLTQAEQCNCCDNTIRTIYSANVYGLNLTQAEQCNCCDNTKNNL